MKPEEISLARVLKKEEIPRRSGWETISSPDPESPEPWVKRIGETDEMFRLTNRTLMEIDCFLSHKLIAALIRMIKENPGRKITFVDFAGGVQSQLVRDILRTPQFKGKVHCTNIDLFAFPLSPEQLLEEGIDPSDLTITCKDIFQHAIVPGTADFIFSYEFLDHVTDKHAKRALEIAGKMLSPGGIALMKTRNLTPPGPDDALRCSVAPANIPRKNQSLLERIADAYQCKIQFIFGETNLDGKIYPDGFNRLKPFIVLLKKKGHRYPNFSDFSLAYPEIKSLAAKLRERMDELFKE